VARLFDAYVIVDWTAAEGKKTGDQSLWIGVVKRDVRFRFGYESHNPATRSEGEALLRTILADLAKKGQRVLLGVDFGLGFPAGTAKRLGLAGEPWASTWKFMAANIVDKPGNAMNNRFAVAAKMNRLMTDEARPFWGAPARYAQRWMSTTKPEGGYGDTPEFRLTERAAKKKGAKPQAVWQMHGASVVGGQTLLGMAMVKRLVDDLGSSVAAWPFGTGWRTLDKADVEPLSVLIAEVHAPLFPAKTEPGEGKTAAAVRTVAETLSRLDEKDELGKLFAPPKGTSEKDVAAVQSEEGWMLGV
jgi:hypothetical protein